MAQQWPQDSSTHTHADLHLHTCRYDDPLPQGTTFGNQSFGKQKPHVQPSAISNVGNMRIGSMAVNMNVENVMKSEDKGRPHWALELLREYCVLSALVDSRERFDPPRCNETTRRAIIQEITDWANNDEMRAELFWLRGGAGAGKSALAQTLSEAFQLDGKLGATYFFSRETRSRSDGDTLIPTITLQLMSAFPELSTFVEDKIHQNAILFSKTRQKLALELLLEPLLRLSLQDDFIRSRPRLIVVDGLDECADPDVQCDLLRIVARLIPHLPYPLRFFFTSRPESHIVRLFDHDPDLQAVQVYRYDLSTDCDATEDIRTFLKQEFRQIHEVHPFRHHLPADWANKHNIDIIVQRSSKHFIYASTVIRYIKSPRHRPHDRLKVIVELLSPPRKDQPYAQLDALYGFIFSGVDEDDLEKVHRVLGLLHLRNQQSGILKEWVDISDYRMIEVFLNLQRGDIILLFDPLLSLVALDDEKDIRILHKSLIDYLLDSTRSTCFHLDLALAHEAAGDYLLTNHLLEQKCDFKVLQSFAFHCEVARFNERLKRYWISLDILYDKFIPPITLVTKFSDNVMQLVSILKILRPLRRKDFDDGTAHTSHVTRLVDIFKGICHASLANCDRALDIEEGRTVLHSMLYNWRPRGFIPPAGVQESWMSDYQTVLSAFIKLHLPRTRFTWRTAVVSSKYFVHYYFLGYGSCNYRSFAFVTCAKHTDKIVLSTDQAHMKAAVREIIISRAKKHLAHVETRFGYRPDVVVDPGLDSKDSPVSSDSNEAPPTPVKEAWINSSTPPQSASKVPQYSPPCPASNPFWTPQSNPSPTNTPPSNPKRRYISSGSHPIGASPHSATPFSESGRARRPAQQERFPREESMKTESKMRAVQNPTTPLSRDEIQRIFRHHDTLRTRLPSIPELTWVDFPWPVLRPPSSPDDISFGPINAYFSALFTSEEKTKKSRKDRIRVHLRQWHPDRFEFKVLPRVLDAEKEKVRQGAGNVAQYLTDLLQKEDNDPAEPFGK